jgi:hypothetical protein
MKIHGIALEEGTWTASSGLKIHFGGDVIKQAKDLLKGVQLRIEHNDKDQSAVVGWVTNSWIENRQGKTRLMYEALVFDYPTIKQILDNKLGGVSVGIWNKEVVGKDGVRITKAIRRIDELSLTATPACRTATVEW